RGAARSPRLGRRRCRRRWWRRGRQGGESVVASCTGSGEAWVNRATQDVRVERGRRGQLLPDQGVERGANLGVEGGVAAGASDRVAGHGAVATDLDSDGGAELLQLGARNLVHRGTEPSVEPREDPVAVEVHGARLEGI